MSKRIKCGLFGCSNEGVYSVYYGDAFVEEKLCWRCYPEVTHEPRPDYMHLRRFAFAA